MAFQALVDMAEVTNRISHEGQCGNLNVKPIQYDRFLVISLGTGSQQKEMKYSADEAAQWGIFSWVTTTNGGTPLLDAFNHASSDMVDSHISSLFKLSIQKITISLSRFSFHIYIFLCVNNWYEDECHQHSIWHSSDTIEYSLYDWLAEIRLF